MAGRNKVLDDKKREVVVALLAGGMKLAQVADYVGCSTITIRREREENEEFDARIRRARASREIRPLEAMRQKSATHWRAAAWMIDRDDRQRAARKGKTPPIARRELDTLQRALAGAIEHEVADVMVSWRLRERVCDIVALWASHPGTSGGANQMLAPASFASDRVVADPVAPVQVAPSMAELQESMDLITGRRPAHELASNASVDRRTEPHAVKSIESATAPAPLRVGQRLATMLIEQIRARPTNGSTADRFPATPPADRPLVEPDE